MTVEDSMLVFQYGSNTSSKRLNSSDRLQGQARDLGLVRTSENYELTFDTWSKSNKCAASDLRPGGKSPAWGVLYEIPDDLVIGDRQPGRKTLDRIEGPNYERRLVEVVGADGSPIGQTVYTYTVKNPEEGHQTSPEYVGHILEGLREHGAPQEYIERVHDIAI